MLGPSLIALALFDLFVTFLHRAFGLGARGCIDILSRASVAL